MSTTFTLWPLMTTSRRLRLATGCAADCGRLDTKANEESPQQQPAKTIPAVVRDTLFMNSLRVGMIYCQFFADFDFRLAFPDGPTYTPDAALRERPYRSGLNFGELCALSVVEKLHLASRNGKRYNLQPP
jgi:hypothetical protein